MNAHARALALLLALLALLALAPAVAQDADESYYVEGRVERLLPRDPLGGGQGRQLEVRLSSGDLVRAEDDGERFRPGEQVELYRTRVGAGADAAIVYYASDHVRRLPLAVLAALFVAVAAVVGRGKGFRAVLGMAFSLAVVVLVIVPAIVAGWDPALAAILGAVLILAASVYFVHGVNWTSSAALAGTVVAAGAALGLSLAFTDYARLSGFASEEAVYIQQAAEQVNVRGLLVAGMIVGSLGALVDSTIAQAAVVRELAGLGPALSWRRLYAGGMGVGFDHIGSLVNTLVLAYAGSALPLFVLFNLSDFGVGRVVNLELVAGEIVQALVGSIALILAVPISTLIAALLFAGNRRRGGEGVGSHPHALDLLGPGARAKSAPYTPPVAQGSRLLQTFRERRSEGAGNESGPHTTGRSED